MSKTSTLQRGYWSEPEEDLVAPRYYVEHPPSDYYSDSDGPTASVEVRKKIFEDIKTEEEHKKFTEEHETKVKTVTEQAPIWAPVKVLIKLGINFYD